MPNIMPLLCCAAMISMPFSAVAQNKYPERGACIHAIHSVSTEEGTVDADIYLWGYSEVDAIDAVSLGLDDLTTHVIEKDDDGLLMNISAAAVTDRSDDQRSELLDSYTHSTEKQVQCKQHRKARKLTSKLSRNQ